jgi:hypothetical protein
MTSKKKSFSEEDLKSLEDGLNAFDRQDYEQAFNLLRPLARDGNTRAQCQLGIQYQLGLGVNRHLTKAVRWWLRAVELGDGRAAYLMGTLFLKGTHEIRVNLEKSQNWYRRASELGYQVANPEPENTTEPESATN